MIISSSTHTHKQVRMQERHKGSEINNNNKVITIYWYVFFYYILHIVRQ